jgi:hypothetical protein
MSILTDLSGNPCFAHDPKSVITRILRHLKLASVPPPIGPARMRQATFNWVAQAHDVARGLRGDVRAVKECLTPLNVCNPVCNLSPHLPAPQGPPEALAYPILRRMSSPSQSRAVPCRTLSMVGEVRPEEQCWFDE